LGMVRTFASGPCWPL